jgi:tryptophan-rich sensory protein
MTTNKFHWTHAVGIFIAANIVSALPAGYAGDKIFYNNFKLPSVAPPDWAFASVWLLLNATSLVALYRIANQPPGADRRWFLISEALGWVLFAAFTTLYFLLRSPVMGAIDTVLGLATAATSFMLALRLDKPAALLIGLRVGWLLLASYVSVWVAMNNVDPFFSK